MNCKEIINELLGYPSRIEIWEFEKEFHQIVYFMDKYWRDLSGRSLCYLIEDAQEILKSRNLDLSNLDCHYSPITEEIKNKGVKVWSSDEL